MANSDYIPSTDFKFDGFQGDFIIAVSTNHVAWGITPTEVTELTDAQAPWTSAWAVAKNKDNRTRAQVQAKKLARKSYTAVLRPFIQTRIYGNPLMTDTDRLNCGIRVRDKVRTRIPEPTGTPQVTPVNQAGNSVLVYFNPPKGEDGSSHRGKPKGVTGMVLASQVGGTPPASPTVCTNRNILTRSPKRFNFPTETNGQTVYYFAAWINAKGETGPWTDLQQFLIS